MPPIGSREGVDSPVLCLAEDVVGLGHVADGTSAGAEVVGLGHVADGTSAGAEVVGLDHVADGTSAEAEAPVEQLAPVSSLGVSSPGDCHSIDKDNRYRICILRYSSQFSVCRSRVDGMPFLIIYNMNERGVAQ